MATDKSEPRVGLILIIGLLAVVTLVCVRGALSTYFDFAVQGEQLRKFGQIKATGLLSWRAQENERLNAGAMPIDQAMDQLARQGRKNATPEFAPVASKDMAALEGWVRMPSGVPTAMIAATQDAGVALAATATEDAGVRSSRRGDDAGASKKTP